MYLHTDRRPSRITVTFDLTSINDEQALDMVRASLQHSRYDSHLQTLDRIQEQCQQRSQLVRCTLNPSAARRIERSLYHVFSRRGLYQNRGQYNLHSKLCRVLGIRLSHRQLGRAA